MASLVDQLRAQWNGDWNIQGVDRAAELARLLQGNGITDLSQIKYTPGTYDLTMPYQGSRSDGAEHADITQTYPSLQLNGLGWLGSVNNDNSLAGVGTSQDRYTSTDLGNGRYDLGWSAQGHGNVTYTAQPDGKGGYQLVPVWGSSSDAKSIRDTAKTVAAAAAMAYGGQFLPGVGEAIGAGAGGLEGLGADQLFQAAADNALATSGNYYAQSALGQAAMDAANLSAITEAAGGTGAAGAANVFNPPNLPDLTPYNPGQLPNIPTQNLPDLGNVMGSPSLPDLAPYDYGNIPNVPTQAVPDIPVANFPAPNADQLFQQAADDALKGSGNYYTQSPGQQWLTDVGNVADVKGGGVLDYISAGLQNAGNIPNPLSSSGGTLGSAIGGVADAVGGGKNLAGIVGAVGGALGGSTADQVKSTDPWSAAQPYLKNLLSDADRMRAQLAAQPYTPQQTSAYNNAFAGLDQARSALPGLLNWGQTAMQSQSQTPSYDQLFSQVRGGLLGPTAQAGGNSGLLSAQDRAKALIARGGGLIG